MGELTVCAYEKHTTIRFGDTAIDIPTSEARRLLLGLGKALRELTSGASMGISVDKGEERQD